MELESVLSELSGRIGELPTVLDVKVEELTKKIDSLHECVDAKFEDVDSDITLVRSEFRVHEDWHDALKTTIVKCAIKTLAVVAIVIISVVVSHVGPFEISKVALGFIGR